MDIIEDTDKLDGQNDSPTTDVFSNYKFREILPGCCEHPGSIVESGCLASISLPDISYDLSSTFPPNVITSGKLSSLQLEGIVYACQSHQTLLPSGVRRGFYIGDAAGIGKGRQIAGVIIDNYIRGRTKHVWFSISPDLIHDAQRDFKDLGSHIQVIEGCRQLDEETRAFGLSKGFQQGVLFSTYHALVSTSSRTHNRFDQLVNWCGGPDFDGCLVFDECHKAKHFVAKKEENSSKVALAVVAIQKLLPKARVIYCSATGVTDLRNMAYMERLGLWGDGCPMRDFKHFLSILERKGLGVAEMLAMELKASGVYLSRSLSYHDSEFWSIEYQLTQQDRDMFDYAVFTWRELRRCLITAFQRTKTPMKSIWALFWSANQRFFRQLCQSIKVPEVVRQTKAALDVGHCVVIGLQSTGEASFEQECGLKIKQGETRTSLISICKEILQRFITQNFPVEIRGEGKSDQWCQQAKDMLLNYTADLILPPTPLDNLIDLLGGPDAVAELTGRRGRMVRKDHQSDFVYECRGSSVVKDMWTQVTSINVTERNSFMTGRKLVAIISDAASTGISLHADRAQSNGRRRVHITLELPWSADKAVQQLGRSHRTNQFSGPIYKLLTTELGGEHRFVAAVASRLESLGALTRGDRRAAFCADLSNFNLNTVYGRIGLRNLANTVLKAGLCNLPAMSGIDLKAIPIVNQLIETQTLSQFYQEMRDRLEEMGVISRAESSKDFVITELTVSTFFNRLLCLPVLWQQAVFHFFLAFVQSATNQAKYEGKLTDSLVDIMATNISEVRPPTIAFKQFNYSTLPTKMHYLEVDRGISWEHAKKLASTPVDLAEEKGEVCAEFYRSKRDILGQRLIVLAIKKPANISSVSAKSDSSNVYRIVRPNTGISHFTMTHEDLRSKYSRIESISASENLWVEAYDRSRSVCLHGTACKNSGCSVGKRCYNMELVCGSILAFLSVLECIQLRECQKLPTNQKRNEMVNSALRVYRVDITGTGERLVGVKYAANILPKAEKLAEEIADAFKKGGAALFSVMKKDPDLSVPTSSASWSQDVVNSIKPNLFKKAFSSPVTITSFFKPIVAVNVDIQNGYSSFSKQITVTKETVQANSSTAIVVKKEETTNRSRKRAVKGDFKDDDLRKEKSLTKRRSLRIQMHNKSDASPVGRIGDDEPKMMVDTTNTVVEKLQFAPVLFSQSSRQSSLVDLFKRQQSSESSTKDFQPSTCPICSIVLDNNSPSSINSHIDNCIIE